MAEADEIRKLRRSAGGYKASFTTAERRLINLTKLVTDHANFTAHAYRDLVREMQSVKDKYSKLEDAMETLLVSAQWAEASEEYKAHVTASNDAADRQTEAIAIALELLAAFPVAIRKLVDGTVDPSTSAPPPSDADKSPKVNTTLKPAILNVDADALTADRWFEQFKSWYSASFLDRAQVAEQQQYLKCLLDSSLVAILGYQINEQTKIYGSDANPGCIEILKTEFESANPTFSLRLALFEYSQGHQSFVEFVANVQKKARLAKVTQISPDELIVHILIKGAKSDLRAKFWKLENPTLAALVKEARVLQSQKANESTLSSNFGKVQASPSPVPINAVSHTAKSTEGWAIPPNVTRDELSSRGITCFCCASKRHVTNKCETDKQNLSCSHCNRKGHIREVCFGNRSRLPRRGGGQSSQGQNSQHQGRPRSRPSTSSPGRTPNSSPSRAQFHMVDVVHNTHDGGGGAHDGGGATLDDGDGGGGAAALAFHAVDARDEDAWMDDWMEGPLDNMKIRVKQNGVSAETVANPDSGAKVNLCSVDRATKMGLEILNGSPKNLVGVDNSGLKYDGFIKVDIEFEGKIISTQAIVSSSVHDKFLVGRQDLKRLGCLPMNFPARIPSFSAPPFSSQQKIQINAADCSAFTVEAKNNAFQWLVDPSKTVSSANSSESSKNPVFAELKRSLLHSFSDVISDKLMDRQMVGSDMQVQLKSGPITPKKATTARQIPHHYRERADEIISTLVEDKIIVPVRDREVTQFCAPAFFVPKSTPGKLRFVVDLSSLNKFIERPHHPFMSTNEVLNAIPSNAKVFCKLDITSGYWQISLTNETSYMTTFLIPQGRFRFTRAPMGMSSSSDIFCMKTDEALRGLPGLIKLVDDLLVVAPDVETLGKRVEAVLLRCREHRITVSESKLHIAERVKFAGFIISNKGIEPDPDQIAAILALAPPKDVSKLRSFLGAVNQLSIFCPDLAHLTHFNRQLLKKDVEFMWTAEHQTAFDSVKAAIAKHMLLNYFDPRRRTELLTDASRLNGIGYALIQRDDSDKAYLIQCGSRSLTGAETRYATIELELLACLWGVQKCRHFLLGHPKFAIVTDHKPLVGLDAKPLHDIANNRLLNIRLKLSDYSYVMIWQAGKTHFLADLLSRNPAFAPPEGEADIEINAVLEQRMIDPMLRELADKAALDSDYCMLLKAINESTPVSELSSSHPAVSYAGIFYDLSSQNGLVIYGDKIVIPESLVPGILKLLHLSHQGIRKTLREARSLYYWLYMTRDITNMVKACRECQTFQPSQQNQPLTQTSADYPMQKVSADFFQIEGGGHFLVMVDRYSGYPFVDQMRTTTTAALTGKFDSWFSDFSCSPSYLRSDGGPQFTSAQFAAWCKENAIVHELSSAHHPRSNGHAESAVKQVKFLLLKHGGKNSHMFKSGLSAYRNSPRDCGYSPCMFFFGRRLHCKLPALPSHFEQIDAEKAEICRQRQSYASKLAHDEHAKVLTELKIGTRVYLQNWKSGRWDKDGVIQEVRANGLSYIVATDDGGQFLRNRVYLRPIPQSTLKPPKRVRFDGKITRHIFDGSSDPH